MSALGPDGYMLLPQSIPANACDALLEAAGDRTHEIMPHRTIPAFLLGMKQCAKYARSALGQDISGLGSNYYSRSAGFATHTDNDYIQALPGAMVSVWVPLADVTEQNGPLVIHRKPILCRKGDVLLIDGDTPHRSCAGYEPRPVALFTYIKAGAAFRPGRTQQRAPVVV